MNELNLIEHPSRTNADGQSVYVDLWLIIWRRKLTVAVSVVLATLFALLYVWTTPAQYRAEVELLPPTQADIQWLRVTPNTSNSGVEPLTVERVYTEFQSRLQSKEVRSQFFEKHGIYEHLAESGSESKHEVFDRFHEQLRLKVSGKQAAGPISLSVVAPSAKQAATWVNEYVALASVRTIDSLLTNMEQRIDYRIHQITELIASKRVLAEKRRQDRLTHLQEALAVAQALGNDSFAGLGGVSENGTTSVNILNLNNLYMLGTRALQAEIDVLKNRESNDPFIEGLRTLEEELEYLNGLSVNKKLVQVFTLDRAAFPPEKPFKPRVALTLVLGVVGGLVLGIVLVFLAALVRR